jgi:6-phosphogluconolactonase
MQTRWPETRWHVARDMDDWLALARARVSHAEAEALDQRGEFHIVLAGGNTPARLYRALAGEAHDWARWQIWLGDERCLADTDPDRNSVMVTASLLRQDDARAPHFHPIPAWQGAETGARAYADALADIGAFDLVLLGLGEDGHTASLFPGQDWGAAPGAPDVLPVFQAPKPPAERISLSAQRLSRARQVLFLVAGRDKQAPLARWQAGEAIPASAIRPPGGVDVLLDPESLPTGATP